MSGNLPPLSSAHPLVSIVTPSYNQARYLEETIQSVLGQDYAPLEYIVIDGGSTDGSVDVIRKYETSLTYWVSERDEGQADALNKGFRIAQGQIVAWVNSDDTYNPGAVRQAVEAFLAQPEIAMVYGRCNVIDGEGRVIETLDPFDYDLTTAVLETKIPQPTVFMRTEALEQVGLLDPELHYALDCDLWLRIGIRFPVKHIPDILANFRFVPGTKSTGHAERFGPELLRIYRRFFARPDLPADIKALEPRVLARVHWRTGLEFYSAGDTERGWFHCAEAVNDGCSVFDDGDFAIDRLIGRHYSLRDPGLIKLILENLPLSLLTKLRVKHRVWSRYVAARFFRAHAASQRDEVRRTGLQALLLDPRRLANRGFLSIYVQALLGPNLAERVRSAVRALLGEGTRAA